MQTHQAHIRGCGSSNIGLVRTRNEDRYAYGNLLPETSLVSNVSNLQRLHRPSNGEMEHGLFLAVVADGMGGHSNGDLAAEMAIETFVDELLRTASESALRGLASNDWLDVIWDAIDYTQGKLVERQHSDQSTVGMGATFTAVLIISNIAYIAHLGDSRCYRLEEGALSKITSDHTVAQLYFEKGILSENELETNPLGHQLYKSLGGKELFVRPELGVVPLANGCRLLLCSDGLNRHVSDQEIEELLANLEPSEACDGMINLAIERGASDNVTVVVLDIS